MDRVENKLKIAIAYLLKDTNGRVIEEIPQSHPVVYLHGISDYVPQRLQNALDGLRVGDKTVVSLTANDAYGPYIDTLILEVSKAELNEVGQLWIGMEIEMIQDGPESSEGWQIPDDPVELLRQDEAEEPMVYIIREIRDETVILDGNHPLAGMDLTFQVQVVAVEQPTVQEIEQGYPNMDDESGDDHGSDFGWGGQDFGQGRNWR